MPPFQISSALQFRFPSNSGLQTPPFRLSMLDMITRNSPNGEMVEKTFEFDQPYKRS